MQVLCFGILSVKVVGNSLVSTQRTVSIHVVVIIVNLCKTGRLISLCAKHAVKNAGLPDLFNFSHYTSLYCKGLELVFV